MIKVISFKICPFVQRITTLLEAKGVPYAIDYISLSDKPQWFLDISPNAQVPVLVTEDGTALFESDAIAEYLDEVYGPLEPGLSPEQRALDRAWIYQASKHYLPQCSAMQSKSRSDLKERSEKLAKAFTKIEAQIGDGPCFRGETIGNVDAAWLPLLHRADLIHKFSGYDFLKGFPKVQAWQAALVNSGLAAKSVSDDFEQVFSDFYLSDKTYLGGGGDCTDETSPKQSGGCCG